LLVMMFTREEWTPMLVHGELRVLMGGHKSGV
jgi:hypothetical protein